MLQLVAVDPESLDAYVPVIGEEALGELRRRTMPPRGAALPKSTYRLAGGVSELLRSLVPLGRDHVRHHFLITRLPADEPRLLHKLQQ